MLDPCLAIWEDLDARTPFQKCLTLAIFALSPVKTRDELDQQIQSMYDSFMEALQPWIRHYIWDYEPIRPQISEHNEKSYIFAQLPLGELIDDEWLITWILYDISKNHEDIFIQVYDNEGEFLLIESWNHLPDWISPDVALNRIWMNMGKLLIIPEVFYMDRGLRLEEALTFLDKASYRCLPRPDIDAVILKKLEGYPVTALQGQIHMEITLEKGVIGAILKQNVINQSVWVKAKEMSLLDTEYDHDEISDGINIKVGSRVETYLLLNALLEKYDLKDFRNDAGCFVNTAVKEYLSKNNIALVEATDEEIDEYNKRGDILQDQLLSRSIIQSRVEPVLEFEAPQGVIGDTEEAMMEKLVSFFRDTTAGIDGVANGDSAEESEDDDKDGDEEAREFLSNANIDIDEDDFFEFFAKDSLKLKDEDLEHFRNLASDGDPQLDIESEEENDEDLEAFGNHSHIAPEEMEESLQVLLKSLTEGLDGPSSTLFQNLK
jgi:hypothetical protein